MGTDAPEGTNGTDGTEPIVALRSVTGMSLVVYPADGVRAALPAGTTFESMDDAERAALRASAVPLTVTERFLRRDDGWWLVQQTGPAWAEPDEASADACGLLFTRLDGAQERHAVPGRPAGPLPGDDELRSILAAALRGREDE